MRTNRMVLCLVIALAVCGLCASAKPAPRPKPSAEDAAVDAMLHLTQALLGTSDANMSAVENGPRDRAQQLAAARREGVLLTARDFDQPLPPQAQNAAPVYLEMVRRLNEKPLDEKVKWATLWVSGRYAYDSSDLAAARKLLLEHQDILALAHKVTERPTCVFRWDWSHSTDFMFPELVAARTASQLLRTESYLLALDGRFREAVTNQARGFRVAAQIGADGMLVHYSTGIACEDVALAGMEDILHRAGPDAAVAEQVRAAITAGQPTYSLRRVVQGELLAYLGAFDAYRKAGYRIIYHYNNVDISKDAEARRVVDFWDQTPKLRQVWHSWLDAGEADILERMRRAFAFSDRPYPERHRLAERWSVAVLTRSKGMVDLWRMNLLAVVGSVLSGRREATSCARQRVLMGAASVLAYKGRRGEWPDRLEEAGPRLPPDPFTGQPLKYRREGDGFVLYSVGEDGRYDGGKPGVPIAWSQVAFRYPPPPPRPRPADPPPSVPVPPR